MPYRFDYVGNACPYHVSIDWMGLFFSGHLAFSCIIHRRCKCIRPHYRFFLNGAQKSLPGKFIIHLFLLDGGKQLDQVRFRAAHYLAKFVLLSVLLAHTAFFFLYTKQFRFLYDTFPFPRRIAYWALAIVTVFIISVAIDQVKLLLWIPIDKMLHKHIKNNKVF